MVASIAGGNLLSNHGYIWQQNIKGYQFGDRALLGGIGMRWGYVSLCHLSWCAQSSGAKTPRYWITVCLSCHIETMMLRSDILTWNAPISNWVAYINCWPRFVIPYATEMTRKKPLRILDQRVQNGPNRLNLGCVTAFPYFKATVRRSTSQYLSESWSHMLHLDILFYYVFQRGASLAQCLCCSTSPSWY